ncbi:MAG TPA: glycoside hydrolase family 130 protein [Acidimicrobiia bacterium]|nr:glycoside hydrolase family 130 protein [Acidimicrobiia bacterium]
MTQRPATSGHPVDPKGVTTGPLRRHPEPVLTAENVPYPATLVFNPGVTKFQGRYVMVFRVDHAFDMARIGHQFHDIGLGVAFSDDGISWEVESRRLLEDLKEGEDFWPYDPRLTVIDDRCYLTFCLDTRRGMRAGIAVTDDFEHFEVLSLSLPDLRNVVLFPQQVNGKYVRLERPFPIYLRRRWGDNDRFDIWISESPDLVHWGNSDLFLRVEDVPFASEKIGPGPPPVLTEDGWLAVFHAVDVEEGRGFGGWEGDWKMRYTAGVMLLDRHDPRRIIGMSPEPVLQPTTPFELEYGFRPGVVFPTGLIAEKDGTCKLYYGAADTVIGLATGNIDAIASLCTSPPPQSAWREERPADVPHPAVSEPHKEPTG